jgi:hypothetical protein
MDDQVPQTIGGEGRKNAGKRTDMPDSRRLGRGDSRGEHQTETWRRVRVRAVNSGGVQVLAALQAADITEVIADQPECERRILGEARPGPWVFCGEHVELGRGDKSVVHPGS